MDGQIVLCGGQLKEQIERNGELKGDIRRCHKKETYHCELLLLINSPAERRSRSKAYTPVQRFVEIFYPVRVCHQVA